MADSCEKNSKLTKDNTVHVKTPLKFERWATDGGFCPNALPHPERWTSRPLLFRFCGDVHKVPKENLAPAWGRFEEKKNSKFLELARTGDKEIAQGGLPLNTEIFHFETNLFKGKAIFRLPCEETVKYFEGKNRKSSILIQGKFKKEMSYRDVYTGQEFCHPVQSPGYFITKAALGLFKTLSPSMEANIVAENEKEMIPNQTHFMSPVAGTASVIQITDEKTAPELTPTKRILEDLTAIGGVFSNSLEKFPDMEKRIIWRRKFFQKIKNLENFKFDTSKVYTFDFYNDKLLMDEFRLAILGKKFDLTQYLAGQPLRIMAKSRETGEYLWNFELWHERQTETWEKVKHVERVVTSPRTPQTPN
eukprot:CAMPEP_0184486460 /NCGR_PEP_ID=MMETSP0113_2-20130426/7954_1 /TAXON_ID=91329 /ORGANISM="Norrisiella sphaerica, Strain BC52" /LENGTH=361 /DNA_ID=CAMNT_0026868355 /DNA_START=59 /DNA_END=1144 /DNA_ORIENTATION=-